jgi:hypothetical protein
MAYKWSDRGRKIFPFTISGAQSGVKMRFDTRRNAVGVILIEQKNAAAAVFEGAGRKDTNRLGTSLDAISPVSAASQWLCRVGLDSSGRPCTRLDVVSRQRWSK